LLARFDVQRSDKDKYSIATVTKVDFSGSVKRIMFHFAKTSSDRDEWIEFGSPRIAPVYSKVPKKSVKSGHKVGKVASDIKSAPIEGSIKKKPAKVGDSKLPALKTPHGDSRTSNNRRPVKDKSPADPTNQMSFKVGGKSTERRRNQKQGFVP
jgi:mbt repeat